MTLKVIMTNIVKRITNIKEINFMKLKWVLY